MSIGFIIVVIATVLIVAAMAVAGRAEYTKRRLRASFGPEYDRAVQKHGGRRPWPPRRGQRRGRRTTTAAVSARRSRLCPAPLRRADMHASGVGWD